MFGEQKETTKTIPGLGVIFFTIIENKKGVFKTPFSLLNPVRIYILNQIQVSLFVEILW